MPDNAFDLAFQGKKDEQDPQLCLYERATGMLAIQKGIQEGAEKLLKDKSQDDMEPFLDLLRQWLKETVVFSYSYQFKEPRGCGLNKAVKDFGDMAETALGYPIKGISRSGDMRDPIEVNKLGLEIVEFLLKSIKVVRSFWDPVYEDIREGRIKVKIIPYY